MLSFVSRSIVLLFTLLCINHLPALGQHKAWRQYTIADGLPGNQVYDMLQDSKGYMWFVTDKGICRFNGYEFFQPVDTTSWSGTEAFLPVEDDKGRIWFNRINQSLWFIEHDTVKEWEYNHVLEHYRADFNRIDQLGFADDGSVWLGLSAIGFLVVAPDGHHKIIHESPYPNVIFTRLKNRIVHALQFTTKQRSTLPKYKVAEVISMVGDQVTVVDQLKNYDGRYDYWGAWILNNDTVLTLFNDMYAIVYNGKVISRFHSNTIAEKAIQTQYGEILLASHTGNEPGLFMYASLEDFKKGNGENLLPNYLVTDVYADPEAGWWASTINGGVMYCKNPGISVFDISSSLPSSNILRLTSDGEDMIYAGVDNKNVIGINSRTNKSDIFPAPGLEDNMMALFYHKANHRLWCGSWLKYWDGRKWNGVTYATPQNKFSPVNAKHITAGPSGDKLLMSSSHGLYLIETQTLSITFFSDSTQHHSDNRTFAVTEDANDNLWVATMHGLKILKGENFEAPPFAHAALRGGIRDMALLKDGVIAFGAPGKGIALLYADGQLLEFSEKDGLTSNDITMLKAGPEGELYVCTSAGLNRLNPLDDRRWTIQNIGVKQGLPSDMVNDVVILADEMWIGTDKGLVKMKEMPDAYSVPAPVIDQFEVDNQVIPEIRDIRLPYDQNNVTIHFYSLHFRSDGDILYRYRLSEADTTYSLTTQREVNYAKLAPGTYTFEVQARQEDRSWSKPALVSFEIAYPWWVRWWFVALLVILLLAVGALIVRTRLRVYRKEAATELKMKDLEMAALRAQINPHFIFNCLGSIQQFIVENDSASATRYLARFAKLVRLALHSSIDGKHSLADEIAMLDNYLALEQMRFKGRFQYQIDAAGIGDLDDIHIPPMLLQPFVENAVKHGIGQSDSEGGIKIAFTKQDNTLLAVITDNGPGFSAKVAESNEAHKSVGLSLTRNRLDLLSGSHEGSSYTQENITDLSGEVKGARVEIRIPLD
jgi:ligand-binding sensor domain-containing protein